MVAVFSCGDGVSPEVAQTDSETTRMTAQTQPGGIELLGTQYSKRLKALYDEVAGLYARPVRLEPTTGHVDNTIEVRASEILIRLRPGSSEDNVAHELLHPVLQHEGYPQMFSISLLPSSNAVGNLIRADLDHLVINQRLRNLGYDPHAGFLRIADSYASFLKMAIPSDPSQRAVFQIGTIHELLKYHYYIADATAERAILQKFPQISGYWKDLKRAVDNAPSQPKPADIWHVAEALSAVSDRICARNKAVFRFSDIIGFEPVPLSHNELKGVANRVFEETKESVPRTGLLLRTFLRRSRMLVAAHVIASGTQHDDDLKLTAAEFVGRREIRVLAVSR
jgi:hypothetical protein